LPHWIRTQASTVPVRLLVTSRSLGAGEKEAIALAFELKARVILDDLAARRLARELKVELVGTAALLYLAKTRGEVLAVRPLLDALLATGFRLSPALYREILAAAEEAQ
jgi:predicted nucleic acid-binding protein